MRKLVPAGLSVAVFATAAHAALFSNLVVFGDSLSDNGNAFLATAGAVPAPPAYTTVPGGLGRFTDGPDTTPAGTAGGLWHEVLAGLLGVAPAEPFLLGGTNFAVGGAQVLADVPSSPQPIPSLMHQVDDYLLAAGGHADANALYVFWGGANDLYSAAETPGETPSGISATEQNMVSSLAGDIILLSAAGAQHFLWLNLPQLATTPRGALDLSQAPSLASAFTAASTQFQADVAAETAVLRSTLGVAISDVDIYSLYQAIIMDPTKYGYTNVTTPADLNPTGDPDQYLFWDGPSHPTTTGHKLIGEAAFAAVEATLVPEPAPWMCAGAGLLLALWRRRTA
ncbi:MAG TPA: SGNH/GDSL hydrolase family protein [Bryobacteraceae bacterium]|nr:SGNH/GDSL hydrolase family protein [Bryobacteraceae bacterium]